MIILLTMQEETSVKSNSILKNIRDIFEVIVIPVAILFAIRSSVIDTYRIPSGSMLPSILKGDQIFANKFAYGLKFPFSDWQIPFIKPNNHPWILIKRPTPKRGDVIIFLDPVSQDLFYIKRVIGVPLDIIEIRKKVLYINDKPMLQEKVPEEQKLKLIALMDDIESPAASVDIHVENLDGREHYIMFHRYQTLTENFGPIQVPSNSLFVMGDNRDGSSDSRMWGFVPMENLRGEALFVFLSVVFDLQKKQIIFRKSRIGDWVY